MTRRLLYPRSTHFRKRAPKKPTAESRASLYLEWYCAKHGIDLPTRCGYGETITRSFDYDGGEAYAYVTRRVPERLAGRRRVPASYETVAKIRIPAWAVPCKRADLWHAAHQAGAGTSTCEDLGRYFNSQSADHKAVAAAATAMTSAEFAAFLAEREARKVREQADREAQNRIYGTRRFDEDYECALRDEGVDGAHNYEMFGETGPRADIAKRSRDEWLKRARGFKKYYGSDGARLRKCVDRARMYHGHLMACLRGPAALPAAA